MKVRIAIVGPTGYTGLYLIRLLLRHPQAELTYLASHRDKLPHIADEFPELMGRCDLACRPIDPAAIAREADVAFLCLPHRAAMSYVPGLLEAGLRVVDLSADYRLKDDQLYQQTYDHPHEDVDHLADAVYGLPELFAPQIPEADLIANPGCYPTAAALGVVPMLQRSLVQAEGIIVNAASGTTGAGRAVKPHLHFPEMNESFLPYNVGVHRHQPEIEQTVAMACGSGGSVLFVPHLLPIDRGILCSIYMEPKDEQVSEDDLYEALEDAFADEPFIRVRTDLPNVKQVRDTNFCDVSARLAKGKVVVFTAIDNMIKGASGQAIQNMNLMFDLPATTGLW
jgi:N-acetyl-gamma-glutamyl-phosphate reductase